MRPSFFLTTPIFYVNDVPHIGHAYTTIAADVLARYKRMEGCDVFFLTGTDEHGQKIEKAAEARGETPKALADRLSEGFKALWTRLGIDYSDFIRTTEARHKRAVCEVFRRMEAAGDVYLGEYEGLYCVPCESFWTELQLVDGNCPDCGRAVEKVTESSYFFRLSAYSDRLLEHIAAHPGFISPTWRENEVTQFVRQGLRDLSISRTGVKWGIPLPDDGGHVFYVWLDALVNYLTATGFPDEGYQRRWPPQTHLIGKDILRFHAVYWPAFLMSAGLPLPEKVVAHGWWTIDGEKMSKSRGNVIDPGRVAEFFGVDVLRYFLLREVPFGKDGDFSIHALVGRANTDLANDLGNLLSRTVTMLHRYLGGVVPETGDPGPDAAELTGASAALPGRAAEAMDTCAFDRALAAIWDVVGAANRYVDKSAPWTLAKHGDTAALGTVLYTALEAQRIASLFLFPFMPRTARRVWEQLAVEVDPADIDLNTAATWGGLVPGAVLPKASPLFPRIDPASVPAEFTIQPAGKTKEKPPVTEPETSPSAAPKAAPEEEYVSIHDFAKLRLQVGTVREAEPVKKSDKLLRLQVDIGTETRQIVAGIARQFPAEEMVGKQVVVITNLRPAKLMGVESQGMLLAAGLEQPEALLMPSRPVEPGSRIR